MRLSGIASAQLKALLNFVPWFDWPFDCRYEESDGGAGDDGEGSEEDEVAAEGKVHRSDATSSIATYKVKAAPPKAKKQKLAQPKEVDDEDEVVGADDDEDEAAVPGEDDEEEDEEEEADPEGEDDEEAEATAKISGPAASAKARSGNVVPKEADLEEVDDEDED